MKYDFNKIINRRNTDSCKWNVLENELPMWVADMDFEIAKPIQDAIIFRASHPIYGYSDMQDEWYEAYMNFYKDRHNLEIKKEWLVFSTGVIPSISSSVRKLTNEGDEVAILTPVYNIFYNSIINNNRKVLEVPLKYIAKSYSIDFDALDKALSKENVKLLILCNPQNPIGKIWSTDDLAQIGRLAKKNNVIVLSDEIHGEITSPDKKYIPFLSVNEINREVGFACVSVTKAFNIAGIHTSAIICPNEEIRKRVDRQLNTDECAEPNTFAQVAAIAALNDSRDWLDQLNEYIENNKRFVYKFIEENIPNIFPIKQDATYLMWVDISKISHDSERFCKFLRENTGLFINAGKHYGDSGEGFIRINVATPLENVKDGMNRLKEGVELYLKGKK